MSSFSLPPASRRRAGMLLAAVVVVVALGGCEYESGDGPAARDAPAVAAPAPAGADRPERPVGWRDEHPGVEQPSDDARAASPDGATVLRGTITDVVDGDTVKAEVRGFETTIRVIGIDTPETRHPALPVQCFGPEASAEMARLLPFGQRVRLVSDPTQDLRDRYDRLLAYVYVPGASGTRGSVNHALVASGHAKVYVHGGEPFLYADAFRTAEDAARAQGRGLWGPPCDGDTQRAAVPPAQDAAGAGAGCDPNYEGACVPPYPPDLGCDDVDEPVRVVGADPHRLDGNGDGVGCSG